MKIAFLTKAVVLICTTLFLSACNEMDNLSLDNEFAEKQEVSSLVDEGTFVSLDKATEIADLFFSKQIEGNASTRSDLNIRRGSASVETLMESGIPLMYIMNYPDGGFVIMGTTKNYFPVLAYSDKNSFKITSEMNGASYWLEETKEAIKTSDALNDTIKFSMQNLWKSYEITEMLLSKKAADVQTRSFSSGEIACMERCDELQMRYFNEGWMFVPLHYSQRILEEARYFGVYNDLCFGADFNHSPISCSIFAWKDGANFEQIGPLLTTQWHQKNPFNNLCNGYSAGCSAIALAQVMKYHQHPQSFSWNGYSFNWNNIPIHPQSGSDQAALVRLVGSFVDMHYSSSGSWASPSDVESGIRLLGYNVTRSSDNYMTVERHFFNNKGPIVMVGNSDNIPLPSPLNYIGGSHYWVCDGVQRITQSKMLYFTEWQPYGNGVFIEGWNSLNSPGSLGGIVGFYFHMNWGWGGDNDGWFAANNVNSGDGNYKYARQNFYISKP